MAIRNGVTVRGTTNADVRGSTATRRARRAWMLVTYTSNHLGFCRCYRCGVLLYNPDEHPDATVLMVHRGDLLPALLAYPLTIDRIIPGCRKGTYRRNNIRPACAGCNSETGGGTRSN